MQKLIQRIFESLRAPPPNAPPNLCFDFLEVYAGSARMTDSFALKGFVAGPPIDIKRGWDLTNKTLFFWLMFMCLAGRIKVLWLGPHAPSFSVARSPKLRSKAMAIGFDLLNWDVLVGNYHMHVSLALWIAQWSVGNIGLLETPWNAFSRALPFWVWAVSLGGTEIHLTSVDLGPLTVRTLAFYPLMSSCGSSRICSCTTPHEPLVGAYTNMAAVYPVPMCQLFADGVHELLRSHQRMHSTCQEGAQVGFDTRCPLELSHDIPPLASHLVEIPGLDDSKGNGSSNLGDSRLQPKFHLWSTQLSESLPWKVCRKYHFRRPAHINVLESHVRRSLLLHVPMNMRVVILQDSMVVLGP